MISHKGFDWSCLEKTFQDFIDEKIGQISQELDSKFRSLFASYPCLSTNKQEAPPEELLQGYDQAKRQFSQKVEAYIQQGILPEEVLQVLPLIEFFSRAGSQGDTRQLFCELMSEYSFLLYAEFPSIRIPVSYEVRTLHENRLRQALNWTTVDVISLNLPGFTVPDRLRIEPYRQCWWCGNIFLEEGGMFPVREKPKDKKHCYSPSCKKHGFNKNKSDTTETENSADRNCCACLWNEESTGLLRKLGSLIVAGKPFKQVKAVEYFEKFLQRRLERNKDKKLYVITREQAEWRPYPLTEEELTEIEEANRNFRRQMSTLEHFES